MMSFPKILSEENVTYDFKNSQEDDGGATGWTGGDSSPPFLTEANFLIRPNPMRNWGGGDDSGIKVVTPAWVNPKINDIHVLIFTIKM